jgi:hypothetical protein
MKREISVKTETLLSLLVLEQRHRSSSPTSALSTREKSQAWFNDAPCPPFTSHGASIMLAKSSKHVKHARIQAVRHASAACVRSPGLREGKIVNLDPGVRGKRPPTAVAKWWALVRAAAHSGGVRHGAWLHLLPPDRVRGQPLAQGDAPSIFRDKNGRCVGKSQSKPTHETTATAPAHHHPAHGRGQRPCMQRCTGSDHASAGTTTAPTHHGLMMRRARHLLATAPQ